MKGKSTANAVGSSRSLLGFEFLNLLSKGWDSNSNANAGRLSLSRQGRNRLHLMSNCALRNPTPFLRSHPPFMLPSSPPTWGERARSPKPPARIALGMAVPACGNTRKQGGCQTMPAATAASTPGRHRWGLCLQAGQGHTRLRLCPQARPAGIAGSKSSPLLAELLLLVSASNTGAALSRIRPGKGRWGNKAELPLLPSPSTECVEWRRALAVAFVSVSGGGASEPGKSFSAVRSAALGRVGSG